MRIEITGAILIPRFSKVLRNSTFYFRMCLYLPYYLVTFFRGITVLMLCQSKGQTISSLTDTWALIFSGYALFRVYPNRIMYRHPYPLHVITTRAREGGPKEKEHRAKQKWRRETHSVTYVPGLFTLSDLSRIVAQPPTSFLCCLRSPSHHPSSVTSVSLVPVLNWLRPSTPFWPYGTHPFIPHAQTISILSDLLYSLTPFLFQLSYA